MLFDYMFVLASYSIFKIIPLYGLDIPSSTQYHIQTDEGPERYFRYQTDSGQYRKEKRLEDGTVVGTYAWIDDNGILQQRDYLADNDGYRILKTTNIYVGRNVPIAQAMNSAKLRASSNSLNSPSQHAVTVPSSIAISYLPGSVQPNTPSTVSSTVRPYTLSNSISSTEGSLVEITPKSIYSTTIYPLLLPPFNTTSNSINGNNLSPTRLPTELLSRYSTYQSSTPSLKSSSAYPGLEYDTPREKPYEIEPQLYDNNNEVSKEISQNSLEYNHIDNPYNFHNGPTYPLDRNGRPYFGQNLRNKYNPQYSPYDGASVTNDGFRYYIPRAYHEEESLSSDTRSGSFGYIDPFGIRRVIYYNTSPGSGFQHRKNNRYVGFQATPYDPRPS